MAALHLALTLAFVMTTLETALQVYRLVKVWWPGRAALPPSLPARR